jgi:hypothetical protein
MKPGIIYRGTIKDNQATDPHGDNDLDPQTWLVHILDHGNLIADGSTEEFVDMVMAGVPILPYTKNNDEDKFSPILETKVELRIETDANVHVNIFAGGGFDRRFETKIWLNNQVYHRGFLKLDDIQQDFMPDPNELLLVSSDNLDVLKDIPLTDDNEETLRGYNKIITYIAHSLKKTGLALDIKVINNIREQDAQPFVAADATFATSPNQIGTIAGPTYFAAGKKIRVSGTTSNNGVYTISSVIESLPTITLNIVETLITEIATDVIFNDAEGHFYNHEFLEAKTFEGDEVGVSHDCYTVLEKILGEHCRLFQHWGQWWIVSIDELDENDLRIFTFDSDGVMDVDFEVTTYEKSIGIDNEETIFFINEDAIVKPTIPHKYIKETFELNTPLEVVCNIDFSRGDLIDEDVGFSTYEVDDWTRFYNFPTGGTNTGDAYIRRNFNAFDLEKDRFLVIEPELSTNEGFVKSCVVPVGATDKFNLSFDWAFSADAAGSGGYTRELGFLLLEGDDGTYWVMDELGDWYQSNSTWTVNLRALEQTIELADDQTDFVNFSVESDPIPVTGDLYLLLQSESISRYNVNVYYNNLQFDYYSYINDGFRPVRGQYHKITSETTNNKVKREKEVFISDSPRKIFKGTLTKYDGSDYILTEEFFKWNIYHSTVPPAAQFKTFGEWQAWWVWNQYRLCNREFDFTAQGVDSNALISTTPNPISPLHKYFLTDTNESTTGRHFMLLHHEADVSLGEWTGFISEVYNEAEGKNYGTTSETASITGRWLVLVYNIGAGNVTKYYMDVTAVSPSGYYKENTPSVPPYPSTADLDADFTYVGAGIADLLTDLGITYLDLVSVTTGVAETTLTTTSTIINAIHDFKFIYE